MDDDIMRDLNNSMSLAQYEAKWQEIRDHAGIAGSKLWNLGVGV